MEHVETVIIGAGQTGLAVGYHLSRRQRPFIILEGRPRVGDNWRVRWDSLRLFTPARYSSLPGWRFPADAWSFPNRDAMADYLEAYASRFALPVRTGVRVQSLSRNGSGFLIECDTGSYTASNVVIASGPHQEPRTPGFASELDRSIVALHSAAYRNPSQLQPGDVLVVGAGNSGTDIAIELSKQHRVWLSGNHPGEIPFRIESRRAPMLVPVIFAAFRHVLTVRTPAGRRARRHLLVHSGPLIRNKLADIDAAGVKRVGRLAGVRDGLPVLVDGQILDVANVVWCTGFHDRPSFVELPVFDADGEPRQYRGVVEEQPGLYFIGREFLYALSSVMIQGADRDAAYIARHIASRRAKADERTPAVTA